MSNQAEVGISRAARLKQIDPEELELIRRGTGRTTAMLAHVYSALTRPNGKRCAVVAATPQHANYLMGQYRELFGHLPIERDVVFLTLNDLHEQCGTWSVTPDGKEAHTRGRRYTYELHYDHHAVYTQAKELRVRISNLQSDLDQLEARYGR